MATWKDLLNVLVWLCPVIALTIWLIIRHIKTQRQANANLAEVARIQAKYKDYKLYVSPLDLSFVGINTDRDAFVVGHRGLERVYPFDQFIHGKALEESAEETRTTGHEYRSGRYSATSRTYRVVSRIDLEITVSDTEFPVHLINFYHAKSIVWQDLDTQIDLVNKVIGYFSPILLDRRQQPAMTAKDDDDDVLEELQKLWELSQAGALTTEEFETMKAKLLRKKR